VTENHQGRRHHRAEPRWRIFLRQYRFELIWLSVVALGVFLILERMNIRVTLFRWVRDGISAAVHAIEHVDNVILAFVRNTTLSDAIGYVLILGALVAIAWRTRWRLMRTPSWTTIRCPQCDSEIHRVHRRVRDRFVGLLIPVNRYRCTNRECRWTGLRVTVPSRRRGHPATAPK